MKLPPLRGAATASPLDPPSSGKHWKRKLALATLAAVISLLLFEGFQAYGIETAAVNTANTPLTMDGLISAYLDNPTGADSLYANRTYYVTGVPISMQQDQGTGRFYSDFVLPGFIQLYWKDPSQASQVIPCTQDACQPILARCFLVGFAVKTQGTEVIMMNNCEFIR